MVGAGFAEAGPMRDRQPVRLADRLEEARDLRPVDVQSILPGVRKLSQAYDSGARQDMDIYIPPNARNAPIIVMVHGGGWRTGDKASANVIENKLRHWLPMGYIVVSVNYRLLPDAMAYVQAEDVAAALGWVQDYAYEWGGSADKIFLMGHSAGAHLVALLSSNPDMAQQRWAGSIVLDSAVMDVSDTMSQRHPPLYDAAFGRDPDYWARTSPTDQWTTNAVPMMVVCSTKRPDKPCEAAKALQDLAARSNVSIPVLPVALSHADVNKTLGLPGPYTDAVDDFIMAHLPEKN